MTSKITLVGDARIQHSVITDRLWELLSVLTSTSMAHTTEALIATGDLEAFLKAFRQDKSCKGCNVALPWQRAAATYIDKTENPMQYPLIDTIYKDEAGLLIGTNTSALATQKAIESQANLYKCVSVLIIGSVDVALPIARHMKDDLNKEVYVYVQKNEDETEDDWGGITRLTSLKDVAKRTYDLVINAAVPPATLVRRQTHDAFAAPLDMALLSKITHPDTIVQETNYFPSSTLLLQMAAHLGLRTVPGNLLLIFGAAESFKRYFDVTVNETTVHMLGDEINAYIADYEARMFENT